MKWWKWWTIVNIGVWAIIYGQYRFNLVEVLIGYDKTYLSFLIIAIAMTSTVFLGLNFKRAGYDSEIHWFTADAVMSIGMVGTIIGFIMILSTFEGIDASSTESIAEAISSLALGMSTALVTTLVGLISSIWLKLQLVVRESK